MNKENNPKIDKLEGVTVSSIVPAGWKLWALLFRAIAEGHLDELNQQIAENVMDYRGDEWFLDATFSDAVWGLFVETCKDTRRELPIEIYDLESPQEALSELKDVAKHILEWYEKALPFIDKDTEEARLFKQVSANCHIVIELIDYTPDTPRDDWEEEYGWGSYFHVLEERPWFRIVNGVCIDKMEFDDFCHVLDCAGVVNWIEKYDEEDGDEEIREKDYGNIKISPATEYGMAFYAFLLLLLSKRLLQEYPIWGMDENGEGIVTGFDCEEKSAWAERFRDRIDWGKDYYLREDSWKEGYLCSDENPSSISSGRSEDERNLLKSLCGRPTFEEVVGAEALDNVISGNLTTEPGFDQYRFLHDKRNELDKLYPLLVRELEYMYQNCDDIVECFSDEKNAKTMKEYSKWRFDAKKANGKVIEEIYEGLRENDIDDLHHFFFERSQFAYEYLWQQPLVHSGMLRQYLQDCIVQDEKLLTVIKRGLDDTPLQQAIAKEMAKKSSKQLRVERAKAELRTRGLIDEHDNIRKTEKYTKIIALARVLIEKRDDGKEFARPVRGWKDFIDEQKFTLVPQSDLDEDNNRVILIDSDNKFTPAFYGTLFNEYAKGFLNGIEWSLYDDVFKLNGELLKGEDLKDAIGNRRERYADILKDVIEKYEKMDNDSFVRITRK